MNHALNLRQPPLSLRQPLAQNASANPLDVMMMKSALGVLGHYEAPEWGVTQFPDAALYSAIANFQKSAGLTADGVMKPEGPTEDTLRATLTNHQSATALHITARSLQGLGRNGDEILAHITPAEAQLLHRVTDGASINPKTGLLEFWYDYEADAAGVGDTASNTGPDRDYDRDNNNGPTTKKNGQGPPASAQPTATTPLTSTPTTVPDQTPQQARPVTVPDDDPSMSQHLLEKKDEAKALKEAQKPANAGTQPKPTPVTALSSRVPANAPPRKPKPPIAVYGPPVSNPELRGDTQGAGHYGASRANGTRKHTGVDIKVPPGQSVASPVSGVVKRNNVDPYGDKKYGGVVIQADDGRVVKTMYVDPSVSVGQRVEAGKTTIGTAQDVRTKHGSSMAPHIHVEGKINGAYYDMTQHMFP